MGAPAPNLGVIVVSERRVDVETLEQVLPILILLLLVLLDGGEAFRCFRLPLGVLVKCVLDVLLRLFDGRQPVVEAGMLHLLVMVAIAREGHTSSPMATRDFFILLLLIVVEVAILPLLTCTLLPGALRVLRSGLLPTSMLGLVHAGGSWLIPAYIAGESRSLRNWIIAAVPGLWVASQSCRGTSMRGYLLNL